MKSKTEGILYKIKKPKVLLFSILWLVIIVGGVGTVGFGITGGEGFLVTWGSIILGVALILYFGYGLIRNVKNVISSNAGLLLDSNGIHDQTRLFRIETILWKDIDLVRTSPKLKMMVVELIDPIKYLNKKNYVTRWMGNMNYSTYGSPIYISLMYLDFNATKLFQDIDCKIREFRETTSFNSKE